MLRALLVAAVVAACTSTSTLPAGAVCKATADCDKGLMCLEVAQFSGSACSVVGMSCSIPCTDNTSCSSLGSSFVCFATCSTDKDCQMTQ